MTQQYLTRQQVRDIDRRAIDEYGLPGLVLMENAGRGCVDVLRSLGIGGPIVICCGRGNNGGDGLVIGRHLDLLGVAVRLVLFADPSTLAGDAAVNYRIVAKAGLPLTVVSATTNSDHWLAALDDADWIVDALLGTGTAGPPRPPLDQVIDHLNRHAARKFAVDLPTGLDCDTGLAAPTTFRADHTATFVAPKVGFRSPGAAAWLGEVHVVSIGAPRRLLGAFGV